MKTTRRSERIPCALNRIALDLRDIPLTLFDDLLDLRQAGVEPSRCALGHEDRRCWEPLPLRFGAEPPPRPNGKVAEMASKK